MIKMTPRNIIIVGVSLGLTAFAIVLYAFNLLDWLAGNPLQTPPGTQTTGAMMVQVWIAQAFLWVLKPPQGSLQFLAALVAGLIIYYAVWPEIQRLRRKSRRRY